MYIFKDETGRTLYVGKAVNLKSRVSSYFRSPVGLGPKTRILVSRIRSVDHILVNSELEALLLESRLIRKFLPPYNIASRDDKTPYYIHLTREEFPRPVINHEKNKSLAGPFLNRYQPQKILRFFRRITPYCTAPRPVKKPCLYSHLGLCSPCPGLHLNVEQKNIYFRNISALRRLLSGQFSRVSVQLKKHMQEFSRNQEFEWAAVYRNQLNALNSLRTDSIPADSYLENPNLADDLALSSITQLSESLLSFFPRFPEKLIRIEMYDAAHLSGSSATGAMTVALSGQILSSEFRHFHIRRSATRNDVAMLGEIITRRLNNPSWPRPDLIVLDGGKSQLSLVEPITDKFGFIPIIALAKQQETIFIKSSGSFHSLRLPINHPGLRLLIRLRDEAHRFSRRLHHHRRGKMLYN